MALASGRTYIPAAIALIAMASGSSVAGVQSYRLDNRMRVALAPVDGARRVALQLWIAAGSVEDGDEHAGLAHLSEHLLARRPSPDFEGTLSAHTAPDYTVLSLDVSPLALPVALAALARRVLEIDVSVDEFERERRVVEAELRMRQRDREWRGIESAHRAAFPGHPYSRSVLGTERSLARIRRAHVFDFLGANYCGARCTLVAAGAFDEGAVLDVARREFARLAPGSPRSPAVELRADSAAVDAGDGREHWIALPAGSASEYGGRGLDTVVAALRDSGEAWDAGLRSASFYPMRLASLAVIAWHSRSTREPGDVLAAVRSSIAGLSERAMAVARARLDAQLALATESASGLASTLGRAQALRPGGVGPNAGGPSAGGPSAGGPRAGGRGRSAPAGRPAAARSPSVAAPDFVDRTLANGVRVIVWRRPEVEVVAARLVWTGGALLETDDVAGLHHLLAASMSAGCARRSQEDVRRQLDEMSGSLEGVVGANTFGVRGLWISPAWKDGLELLVDCALSPELPDRDLERRRRQLIGRMSDDSDDDAVHAHRLAMAALFPGHPYGRPISGSVDVVSGLRRREMLDFHRKHYVDRPFVLSVVGDVEPDKVLAWARAVLGRQQGLSPQRSLLPAMSPAQVGEVYGTAAGELAQLEVAFRGTGARSADRHVLAVVAAMLDRRGGQLHGELVSNKGLAYDVGAMHVSGLVAGYLSIYASVDAARVSEIVAVVRERVGDLSAGRFSQAELDSAISTLVERHDRQLERRAAMASSLAVGAAYGVAPAELVSVEQALRSVTRADIVRVANAGLDWSDAVVATVMPASYSPAARRRAQGVRRRARRKKVSR